MQVRSKAAAAPPAANSGADPAEERRSRTLDKLLQATQRLGGADP